jgi:murein DD-endopeptidase MepM/ murein hydrolase activator NlpD
LRHGYGGLVASAAAEKLGEGIPHRARLRYFIGMHDRRSPSRSERRIALSFALMLPVLAGCNIYDSMVYGSRKGTVEYPGSGASAEPVTPAGPPGSVQAQSLPPPTGAPPTSAAGSLPPASGAASGSAASGVPPAPAGAPAFGNQTAPAATPATPAPVPLPRGGGAQVATADPPTATKPQFQWPVRGKVLAKYGPQAGGAKNDGIDIAAPSGAPIKAAAGGKVVYVGSGVASLGNVVLIQHPGGYVTAYAHTEQTLVKKDDVVSKGQTIATVGQTGSAKQPMLHFEVRQAKEPIDPSPLLGP